MCDIVMKGGLTSGIVYPPAILRIAQRFRFRNIGGTSAGAIAAAGAAAAEFRRQSSGSGDGYVRLRTQVMDWLATGRNMLSLLVPVLPAVPIFYFALWTIGLGSAFQRTTWIGALNLAISGACALVIIFGFLQALGQFDLPLVGRLPQTAAMLAILAMLALVLCFLFVLPFSNFGMCTGGRKGTLSGRGEPLTFWLARQLDEIAGCPAGRPLTFGDLWDGRIRGNGELEAPVPHERVVNLEMIATCVTMGRPFRLPFEQDLFYFKRGELERFFPDYVVQWLVDHPRAAVGDESQARHEFLRRRNYLPLPSQANLPVIVATRLSASYPLLLSAIRLFTVDHSSPYNRAHPAEPQIEPAWFSDGGLSSNFPISFFDAPIPRWPTMAITLEAFPPGVDSSIPANGAYVPTTNRPSAGSTWIRFSEGSVPSNTPGFYGAILNAMQNWQDAMLAEAPGFRDRIAHVRLTAQQGGLNLTMPKAVIASLLARGELAGALLVDHFQVPAPPPTTFTTNWDNQRWIRARTTFDVLQRYAQAFRCGWQDGTPGCPTYQQLVADGMTPPSDTYRFRYPEQIAAATKMASDVIEIADVTDPSRASLSGRDAPKPISDLTTRPRY